jgi:hypothetical protein
MRLHVVVLSGFFAVSPAVAAAQSVNGRVIDAASRLPVPAVEVKLLQGERVIARALVDSTGRFVLNAGTAGRYHIVATRIGYADAQTPPLDLTSGQMFSAELQIAGTALRFAPLAVDASRDPYLERAGFYERMRTGNGYYLTGTEIQRRNPATLVDVLRTARGMKVQRVNQMRHEVYLVSPQCLPQIVVDGVMVRWGGTVNNALRPLEELVRVPHIDAVEVYRPSQGVPPQYAGANSQCGTILIWTRHS